MKILIAGVLLALLVGATDSSADFCGRPISRGEDPTVADALHVLRSVVGQGACVTCECDVDGNGVVRTADALRLLKASVQKDTVLHCPACRAPNFVVFLTDDQRADTLWAMRNVQELMVTGGVEFLKAYSTTAECCPFRASFLSGGYRPANTGVKDGNTLNGGMSHFRAVDSLPRRLQQIGYTTGFIGKYMHGYYPGYVPPGWTSFVAHSNGGQLLDWNNLTDITFGSSTNSPAAGEILKSKVQYVTDFHRDEAVYFVRSVATEPFFLLVSILAPHWPTIPAPQDLGLYSDFDLEGPWYVEADLSDKPQWVHNVDAITGPGPKTGNARATLESLQSVDRMVRDVMQEVNVKGAGDDTYYFFLSDNGLMWGEHRLPADKGMPYEESVRVPLVVSGPDIKPDTMRRIVSADLDVPATILDLAGLDPVGDGESFVPFLRGASRPWRTALLLENYGYLESAHLGFSPFWAALRMEDKSGSWKYVEYPTGEREMYDLISDPHEMENRIEDSNYKAIRNMLRDTLKPLKGLAIFTRVLAPMHVGVAVEQRLDAWGGTHPLKWSVVAGTLPPGVTLAPNSGILAGTPISKGISTFTIRVTDSGIATHSLKPQEFNRVYTVDVKP